mmetsp:Transcript_15186/g.48352  ORF Transcript_15186/g.48352 Transcript_15186/m.48352 type:complete len:390 (+) Transcript_15186:1152-2321(+)
MPIVLEECDELVLVNAACARTGKPVKQGHQLALGAHGEAERARGVQELTLVDVAVPIPVEPVEERRYVRHACPRRRSRFCDGSGSVRVGAAELCQIAEGLFELAFALSIAPVEERGHDLRHAWCSVPGSLRIEKRQARAKREYVANRARIFVFHGVLHLVFQERVALHQTNTESRPALLGGLRQLAHSPSPRAIRARKVLGDLRRNIVLLYEFDEQVVLVPLAPHERNVLCRALACVDEVLVAHHCVNDILRHLAIRGPLAARDEGDARGRMCRDDVIAGRRRPRGGVWVHGERAPPAPGRKHVSAADAHVRREVLFHLIQDPLDLILGGGRATPGLAFAIGGSNDGMVLPRQEEEEAAIRGVDVEQAHRRGRKVSREDDVSACGPIHS